MLGPYGVVLMPIFCLYFFVVLFRISLVMPSKIIISDKITVFRNWFNYNVDEIPLSEIKDHKVEGKFMQGVWGVKYFVFELNYGKTMKVFIPGMFSIDEDSTDTLPELVIKNHSHPMLGGHHAGVRGAFEYHERLRAYVDKKLGKTFESEVYALKDEGDENVKGEES